MAVPNQAQVKRAKDTVAAVLKGKAPEDFAPEATQIIRSEEVVGVGVGLLDSEEENAGAALVFYVSQPLTRAQEEILSKQLKVKIRVEVTGEFFPTDEPAFEEQYSAAGLGHWALIDREYRKKMRPCPAGYSVGTRKWSGTIGLIVINDPQRTQLYICSNNHVLNNDNSTGYTEILQPGGADGGISPRDTIGRLDRFIRLEKKKDNYMDAATAIPRSNSLLDPRYGRNKLVLPGHYLQYRVGWRLWKAGRTTGDVEGVVDSVHTDVRVNYGSYGGLGVITFKDQTIVKGVNPVSIAGDSGSCWLRKDDNFACAINYAGPRDGKYSICFPINWFMSAFKCKVARPGWITEDNSPSTEEDALLFSSLLPLDDAERLADAVEYGQ